MAVVIGFATGVSQGSDSGLLVLAAMMLILGCFAGRKGRLASFYRASAVVLCFPYRTFCLAAFVPLTEQIPDCRLSFPDREAVGADFWRAAFVFVFLLVYKKEYLCQWTDENGGKPL